MKHTKKTWLNLVLAPLWFLIAIVVLSVYYSIQGEKEAAAIAEAITNKTSIVILFAQIGIFVTLLISCKLDKFELFANLKQSANKADLFKGIAFGAILAVLYVLILSPLHTQLQLRFGDYVSAGETMHVLGNQIVPFFIANVIFAPFVEESLYRSYALKAFSKKYSIHQSIAFSSIMFGLLHWTGGIWYVLITAALIGVPFSIIASKKKNIFLVFIAHFTLNLLEFIYILLS